jgi:hypothetical protein
MKKTAYIQPEIELIVLKEKLLETMPKDSNVYDDDDILGKDAIFEEDKPDDSFSSPKSLWDE